MSTASTCRGSASPRQRIRNCAAAFSPCSTSDSGTGGAVAARRLRDDRERRRREPREVVARLLGLDVDELLQAPLRPERRERGLQVGHHRAARVLQLDPLGLRHARLEAAVDEQAPDLLERVVADELLDVDAAVPERRAFLVGLRDLRLERDHALEPWPEVVHAENATATPVARMPPSRQDARRSSVQSLARDARVTLIPGDGTGPELTEATRRVLEATGVEFEWDVQPAGADVMARARRQPAARGDARVDPPERRRAQGPDHDADRRGLPLGQRRRCATRLDLYAQVRPCKTLSRRAHALRGRRPRRSSARTTEDIYAGIEFEQGTPDARGADRLARARTATSCRSRDSGISIKPISITGTRRVFEFAFDYARRHGPPQDHGRPQGEHHEVHRRPLAARRARRRRREPRHRVRRPDRRQHVHAARPAARGVRRAGAAEPLRRHPLRPRRRA